MTLACETQIKAQIESRTKIVANPTMVCGMRPWAQFHQHSTYSYYTRGAQKSKKDSKVIILFTLSGSTSVKAERKCVGEIEPMWKPILKTLMHPSPKCLTSNFSTECVTKPDDYFLVDFDHF
jgi:hypothetical protein